MVQGLCYCRLVDHTPLFHLVCWFGRGALQDSMVHVLRSRMMGCKHASTNFSLNACGGDATMIHTAAVGGDGDNNCRHVDGPQWAVMASTINNRRHVDGPA